MTGSSTSWRHADLQPRSDYMTASPRAFGMSGVPPHSASLLPVLGTPGPDPGQSAASATGQVTMQGFALSRAVCNAPSQTPPALKRPLSQASPLFQSAGAPVRRTPTGGQAARTGTDAPRHGAQCGSPSSDAPPPEMRAAITGEHRVVCRGRWQSRKPLPPAMAHSCCSPLRSTPCRQPQTSRAPLPVVASLFIVRELPSSTTQPFVTPRRRCLTTPVMGLPFPLGFSPCGRASRGPCRTALPTPGRGRLPKS